METLKKHIPLSGQDKLHELKDIALRFEDKTFTAATNQVRTLSFVSYQRYIKVLFMFETLFFFHLQSDYMRTISVKLLSMENRSANPIPNSLQSNSARNTVNPSDSGTFRLPILLLFKNIISIFLFEYL